MQYPTWKEGKPKTHIYTDKINTYTMLMEIQNTNDKIC